VKLQHQIFLGIALGLIVGFLAPDMAPRFSFMGVIFLSALKMIIAPLIMASMIVGVSSLGDVRKLGRIGGLTVGYYALTTALSVLIGLVLVNLIVPGKGVSLGAAGVPELVKAQGSRTWSEFLSNQIEAVFRNPFDALANMDVLAIIVFSLLFGGVLSTLGEPARGVITFFEVVNKAMMKLTSIVMYIAPFGVFALMADAVAKGGVGVLVALGKYVATVTGGLALHGLIVLPAILVLLGRRRIGKFFASMQQALVVAFSTSSSSATLPVTMKCAVENMEVSEESAGFVLPLGATINMDGTALYEAVAALFIAQAYGISLGPSEQFVIFITATLAAVGAAGIPSAGLVTMAIVLKAVGLPLEGIGMILAVDRILDMFRTTVNVEGDSVGVVVIDRMLNRRKGGRERA